MKETTTTESNHPCDTRDPQSIINRVFDVAVVDLTPTCRHEGACHYVPKTPKHKGCWVGCTLSPEAQQEFAVSNASIHLISKRGLYAKYFRDEDLVLLEALQAMHDGEDHVYEGTDDKSLRRWRLCEIKKIADRFDLTLPEGDPE